MPDEPEDDELVVDTDELEAEPDDFDEVVLDDDALVTDDVDDPDVDETAVLDDPLVVEEVPAGRAPTDETDEASDEDEDVVLALDDEQHPDDVEEPLDVLLQERTASATLEDDEEDVEEDEVDVDDRGEGPARIVPRRPGEFLCASCFLVLPRNQLADEKRMLCRDCA